MTTPPITRRCPFCGAPAALANIASEQRHGSKRIYVACINCTARGPDNGYDDECRQIAAAVWDWNTRATAREWRTNGAAIKSANKREAYITKWATTITTTTTTTTKKAT